MVSAVGDNGDSQSGRAVVDMNPSEHFPPFPDFPPPTHAAEKKPLKLRTYQSESVERAIQKNTIVVLPTNCGKTLVAVNVIDHFRRTRPSQVVVFTVPTVALVGQQAAYCREHCAAEEAVVQLCGMGMEDWDAIAWRKELRNSTVLVGTPEVFRNALDKGFLHPGNISLLVFDECHQARGMSPMARIMNENIARAPLEERPRILGLTASFVAGAVTHRSHIERAKIELELLLQADIMCPDVGDECVDAGVQKWHRVPFPVEGLETPFGASVDACIFALINDVDPEGKIRFIGKTIQRMRHVLMQVGMQGFKYAMKYNVMHHLSSHAMTLAQVSDPAANARAAELSKALPDLRKKLENYGEPCAKQKRLKDAPMVSKKAEVLLGLLRDRLAEGKGLVFVTQVILTAPLAYLIDQYLTDCTALPFYGGMPKKEQDDAMRRFRLGEVRVLVSTDALLEGIDVPDCEWVVRFDEFNTTKSHIQGSGRARSSKAQVYYFHNDPEAEQERASLMSNVAGDDAVRATEDLRQDVVAQQERRRATAKGVHPFEEPDAKPVHFGNGFRLVYTWAQQICKDSFSADRLVEWAPEEDGGELLQVNIPGPDGWLRIDRAEVDHYWGDVRLKHTLDPTELRLSDKELEKRRALFVAAVRLRKMEWLGKDNRPNALPLMKAQIAFTTCEQTAQPPKISIRKTYPPNSRYVPNIDFVSALNQWSQKRWPSQSPSLVLKYSDEQTLDGWISHIEIFPLQMTVTGSRHFQQKALARQDVARRALEAYRQLGAAGRGGP